MEVSQEKYRKILSEFRQPLNNLISQYPINLTEPSPVRNLKYIVQKQSISTNLPYDDPLYDTIFQDIKRNINSENLQSRILAIRLARVLPFSQRIQIIEELENQIIKLAISQKNATGSPVKKANKQKSIEIVQSKYQFSYEILSDIIDLLLSVYELTWFSEEIYFNVNQRIISIFSRIIQSGFLSQDGEMERNMYESIRSIFLVFGPYRSLNQLQQSNKLINKLVTYYAPNNSFVSKGANLSNVSNNSTISQKSYSNKFLYLILRTRQFEARIRSRFLQGVCCLLTYSEQLEEMSDFLIQEIFVILENVNECDVNIECFNGIKTLINSKITLQTRTKLIKKWMSILADISYKKQYLEYFIALLDIASNSQYEFPLKVRYFIGMSFLQITKNIQQQFSRFIVYRLACKNIMSVNNTLSKYGNNSMIILNIFQYSWFLDRINQDNDIFRSQFLICLLQSFFTVQQKYSNNQVRDLIGFCHRLLDWKCLTKEENYIPTIKFAFDMYLAFFRAASEILGQEVEKIIEELIEKCNDVKNIYILFRLKMTSMIVSLPWYQKNCKFLSQVKFNFDDLDEEIRTTIMPKNSKPIFDLNYAQTPDGLIESRRQIEFVKVVFQLLINLQKAHEQLNPVLECIQIDYHGFLNELEMIPSSNKDLIYCLQTGTADQYLTECQRNFLLSLIDQYNHKGHNFELNLDGNIMYSPYETYECEDEINIFGAMSPVQLTVKFHMHDSFSSIYLQVKKNNWVSTPKLKLMICSGMQKKEMSFESRIVEMRIDRVGGIHFEVWTAEGNQLLIGSGNLKIKRKLRWRKVNYLSVIDGIKRKSYFKKSQSVTQKQCYLSYYYGEPIVVQIFRSCNQVVFGVSSKEVWNDLQSCLSDIIEEFTDGSADVFQ